jgi:rubrerythrin
MKNSTEVGMNRSGLSAAPRMGPEALEVRGMTPKTHGDAAVISAERIVYMKTAEPLATMPPPGTLKQLAAVTLKLLKGEKAVVLMDKVGERLGFERGGVRLYEALLSKYDALGSWDRGPTRSELEDILREELEHFHLLAEVMHAMGGDPTAVTPSAEVHDVAAQGLRAVLTDPRVNLQQSLEAILIAELEDNDCWQNLVRLASAYNEHPLAQRFQRCLEQERVHLARVRNWIAAGLSVDAFGDPRRLLHAEPCVQTHGRAAPQRTKTPRPHHAKRAAAGRRNGVSKSQGNGTSRGKRGGNGARKR